jgi:hypothetical protein
MLHGAPSVWEDIPPDVRGAGSSVASRAPCPPAVGSCTREGAPRCAAGRGNANPGRARLCRRCCPGAE